MADSDIVAAGKTFQTALQTFLTKVQSTPDQAKADIADPSYNSTFASIIDTLSSIAQAYPYTRWTKAQFYEGGNNIGLTLDQMHNLNNPNTDGYTDTRDYDMGIDMLNRMGIHNQFTRNNLTPIMGAILLFVGNPDVFINPNAVVQTAPDPTPVQKETQNNTDKEQDDS